MGYLPSPVPEGGMLVKWRSEDNGLEGNSLATARTRHFLHLKLEEAEKEPSSVSILLAWDGAVMQLGKSSSPLMAWESSLRWPTYADHCHHVVDTDGGIRLQPDQSSAMRPFDQWSSRWQTPFFVFYLWLSLLCFNYVFPMHKYIFKKELTFVQFSAWLLKGRAIETVWKRENIFHPRAHSPDSWCQEPGTPSGSPTSGRDTSI